jgi:hypothetical protein
MRRPAGPPAKAAKKAVKKAAKKAPAKKAAKKVPAKKAPAKKAAKKAAAKKAPAKKAAPQKALPAPPTDPLAVLGLRVDFTRPQLRRAWRTYAAAHHPDQGGDAATFHRGLRAYEALLERVS